MAPDQSIQQIKALMMGGYGAGASQATINAMTRDRMVIAGRPIPQQREDLAEQTLSARGDTTGLLGRMLRIAQRSLFMVGLVSLVLVEVVRLTTRYSRVSAGDRRL
ncbi:hypothetical protein [Homoserinimonas sp. OAct 916]|uniref:hypothetical protein n=1 Tax=Homoserinimonas sp. OAct 916 TaxID=2211450 RepID=UPI000DBE376F|nr:hypothetical protein [Homoserinimonas sp. OAct 916]